MKKIQRNELIRGDLFTFTDTVSDEIWVATNVKYRGSSSFKAVGEKHITEKEFPNTERGEHLYVYLIDNVYNHGRLQILREKNKV